jgi:predicted amidophosphoribosyltransferase
LGTDDRCYYARDYISKGGFSASDANRLISNFKKPVNRRGLPDWKYKGQAIRQFANELTQLLGQGCFVAPIPCSKCKTDADYDSRLEDSLAILTKARPDVKLVELLSAKTTLPASHLGGGRKPDAIYENLSWNGGLPQGANHVIFVDDVITTGGHFKACQRMVIEHHPEVNVIGVFWAKTVWLEPSVDDVVSFP